MTEQSGQPVRVAKIATVRDCPKCGNTNPPDTRYCDSCGASLLQETVAATPQKKGGLFSKVRRKG
ncbi:MAG: zinc-ribbon domain-containing protein [Anaerolineae bacterium]